MQQWVRVAALSKAKNNEGGLVVRSTAGLPFLLEPGMEVVFVPPVLRIPRCAKVEDVQQQDGTSALVFFEGITTRTMAEELAGHYCLVKADDLPEIAQEEGVDVRSFTLCMPDGTAVGKVIDIQENPAHPLAVVERDGAEVLVPLVEAWIEEIDEQDGRLVMALPSGLLDI